MEARAFLREDPARITLAGEEFLCVFTPLTHIGRVSHAGGDVLGRTVPAEGRVSLCLGSANLDETVLHTPAEVRLDRKPNPHVAFGFGAHICLGAAHARLILRSQLKSIVVRTASVAVLDAVPHVKTTDRYERAVGFDRLVVKLTPR